MSETSNIVAQSYNSPPKYTEIQTGLPEDYQDIKTLGDLLAINYKLVGVKQQLRRNLISLINSGKPKYPGIVGFEDDVIPALDRAILSCHDIFLVGQIGQAKTKIVETISKNLLSPIPVIKNSITNDCPMDLPENELVSLLDDKEPNNSSPKFYVSPESAAQIRDNKQETQIEWVEGKDRYKYVLATPDISVKDLVGYIDAVKVAKKGIEMYQIDYTNSGKVIEPLYDRLKSHIHTHYPKSIENEMLIILQEANISKSFIISPILKTLSTIIHKARKSHEINQERGVSVRIGIHGLELLVGESERTRALLHKILPVPRLSDMHCLDQVAKFEIVERDDTIENREKIFHELIDESIQEICLEYLNDKDVTLMEYIKQEFQGKTFQVSQKMIWKNGQTSYENQLENFKNLKYLVELKVEQIRSEQKSLIEKTTPYHIDSTSLIINETGESELRSVLTEIILEGLRWINPKILERKEAGYVSA